MEEYGIPKIKDSDIDNFLSDISRGTEVNSAFWANGIPAPLGMEILATGKIASMKARPLKKELPMIKFWYAYSKAITGYHKNRIESIKMSEDWKAHRYLLEASAPEAYGLDNLDPNNPNQTSLKD